MTEKAAFWSCILVRGLSEEEKGEALRAATPRAVRFAAGETVVTAGDTFASVGLVAKGTLTVTRAGEHRRVIHKRLGETDLFGVSSLFGGNAPFPTTIIAETDALVLLFDEAGISRMLAAVPHTAERYIALLSEKIRFLNRRLDTLAGRSAEERVAAYLLSRTGNDGASGITRSALASTLGLGRASLYRALDALTAHGLIRMSREAIEVVDSEALNWYINTERNTKK